MAEHPYVDYEYYASIYHGSSTKESFGRTVIEAEAFVDQLTFGRLLRLPEISDAVKNAVCAAADAVARREESRQRIGIKSEANDGVSVTYADAISDEQCAGDMAARVRTYLANTGLLYRGFSDRYDRRR